MLNGNADQIDGVGRDLLKVLGVSTIQAAIAALSAKCNGTGQPDFSGLMVGDYIDGIDLSAIPAENGGTAGQAWNNTYKNNRIILSGFNTYKGSGDAEVTKNHLLFNFRNIPIRKRMNPINDDTGGYTATEMRVFLDGTNGDGTGDMAGVTTAAFLNALKAQIGDHIMPIRRLLSNKVPGWVWATYSLFLPSEDEVLGESIWGESGYGDGLKLHYPIYQRGVVFRIKRYNGARDWYFLCTPYSASAANFCFVNSIGYTNYYSASAVGGCAPAFCVA
jgi:hypothetical protein